MAGSAGEISSWMRPMSPGSAARARAPDSRNSSKEIAAESSPREQHRRNLKPGKASLVQRAQRPRMLHEDEPGPACFQRPYLLGGGQGSVEGGRDRACRHHAHVGQVELGARLGSQPDNVALAHAIGPKRGGDPLRRGKVFAPAPGAVGSLAHWLVQRRPAVPGLRRRAQHAVDGPFLLWNRWRSPRHRSAALVVIWIRAPPGRGFLQVTGSAPCKIRAWRGRGNWSAPWNW